MEEKIEVKNRVKNLEWLEEVELQLIGKLANHQAF